MALREGDLKRYGLKVSPDPAVRMREWTNRRTGEIVQVPRGIDPGFQHNVGRLDPVRDAVRVAERRHGPGSVVPSPPANPSTWEEYAVAGREAVEGILSEVGGPGAAGFDAAFRGALLRRMGDRVGGEAVDVVPISGGRVSIAATGRLRDAVEAFVPASWVRAGNRVQVRVQGHSRRDGGHYRYGTNPPEIRAGTDPATSVHEYVHHLQWTAEGFHAPWEAYYKVRTTLPDGTREPTKASKYGSRYRVREDGFIDDYMGHDSTRELAARAYEILSHGLYGREAIGRLAVEDPLTLHFAVGFLLKFDP